MNRKQQTLPITEPSQVPVVLVRRARRRQRALARENPQAFPDLTAKELLRDLESPEVDEDEG